MIDYKKKYLKYKKKYLMAKKMYGGDWGISRNVGQMVQGTKGWVQEQYEGMYDTGAIAAATTAANTAAVAATNVATSAEELGQTAWTSLPDTGVLQAIDNYTPDNIKYLANAAYENSPNRYTIAQTGVLGATGLSLVFKAAKTLNDLGDWETQIGYLRDLLSKDEEFINNDINEIMYKMGIYIDNNDKRTKEQRNLDGLPYFKKEHLSYARAELTSILIKWKNDNNKEHPVHELLKEVFKNNLENFIEKIRVISDAENKKITSENLNEGATEAVAQELVKLSFLELANFVENNMGFGMDALSAGGEALTGDIQTLNEAFVGINEAGGFFEFIASATPDTLNGLIEGSIGVGELVLGVASLLTGGKTIKKN